METEETFSEHVNVSPKEPESCIISEKEYDSMSQMDTEVSGEHAFVKSPLVTPDANDCSDLPPPSVSSVVCEQPSESLPSPLTFEISNSLVDGQSLSEEDHEIQSPKDVEYTEKINLQSLGVDESGTGKDGCENLDEPSRIFYFVNQDAKVTPSPIIQYVLDVDQHFDTVISCADGRIGAHRLVLASASPFIGDMFCSHDHRLGEVAVLVLPDVKVSVMKVLLNFCYTGSMYFPIEDKTEVLDAMKLLLVGEFGDLSLKEVTVKVQPVASSSAASSGNLQQSEVAHSQSDSNNANILRDVPEASSSLPNSGSPEDLLMTSSSEDEEDDNDDSKNEGNSSLWRESKQATGPDEEHERIAFANNFLRHKKESIDNEINYLIGPKLPGCKTKKLQCYHCPGAFKSIETLTAHLDNNHGILLQCNKLKKSEFEILTNCSFCSTPHSQVSTANMCVSKRSKTRCYICFEIVRIKDFEHHIKSTHALEQRNGMCIVKCRWCEAGFLLQDPIDNKAMAAHCFSNHLPGSKNGNGSVDFDFENEEINLSEVKMEIGEPSSTVKKQYKLASIFTNMPSSGASKQSKLKSEASTSATPKGNTSKTTGTGQKPAVLALLEKASQKRKLVPELEYDWDQQNDNPKKKPRLDENGKRIQVARRTGKPVGRLVHIEELKSGVPSMKSDVQKGKTKTKSVLIDVSKLPNIYVNFKYSKNFLERFPNLSSVPPPNTTDNLSTDTVIDDVGKHYTNRRLSDSRCSMPCP